MSLPGLGFWLFHAAACLAVSALAWGLGALLARLLRVSHAAHGYWLGVWMLALLPAIAAVALDLWTPAPLAALPDALSLPTLTLEALVPLQTIAEASPVTLPGQTAEMSSTADAGGVSVPVLLAALYLATVAVALLQQVRGSLAVRGLVRAAQPIAPNAWPGPASATEAQALQPDGIQLRVAPHGTTPFAVSWPTPAIVLPAFALEQFNDRQLRLVLRHEAAHLLHRDPQRAAAMRVLTAVFWFDPFLRLLGRRVQMAAELRCDAWALAADRAASHEFAGAYLKTLRLGLGQGPVLTALAGQRMQAHRLRIRRMLEGDPDRLLPRSLGRLMAGLALVAAGALSLGQFALANAGTTPVSAAAEASSAGTAPAASAAPATSRPAPADATSAARRTRMAPEDAAARAQAPAGTALVTPVQSARISSRFGAVDTLRPRAHRGIDFAARRGTPVHAVAAGQVITATAELAGNPDYGTVVVIDHGAGRQSLYAHLDSFEVQVGQRVQAGSAIGRIGTTGKTTGPHLHLELLENGQRIDPEPHLR